MIDLGQRAPAVTLPDSDGAAVEVAGPALLVFLPAAFSPVCTGEVGGLAEIGDAVARAGVVLLGVSCDSVFTLNAWARTLGPGAPRLVSDFWPHGEVARAFGAFDHERGIATRVSYLIDADGVVRWSTRSPSGVARDMTEHRAAVERLALAS